MANLGTAKLAGVVLVVGILAIAGINLAFAQNATSTPPSTSTPTPPSTPTGTQEYPCAATPFYGAQAYGYIACTPIGTAQMEGLAIVGGVVALSIAFGAAGRQYHTIP